MRLHAPGVIALSLTGATALFAQERVVFEGFEAVAQWPGFELSSDQARSGRTSALWHNMDQTPSVACDQIPHDWSRWGAFVFWVYCPQPRNARFMCIIRSENPASQGADYWAVPVSLNYTGWRRFGILIGRGGGARQPLGWDQVQGITFTASGWGNTPDPKAVVYIDDLTLTNEMKGPGPILSDQEFFGLLRQDIPALRPSIAAARDGDYAKAKAELLAYMRAREGPVHRFDWRQWDKSRQEEYDTRAADRVCRHSFSWFGREADLGPDINWQANGFDPDEPAYTPEWTYNLNRFGYWGTLGRTYWATGDEKYAQEFVSQMLDWVRDQLPPVLGHPNSGPCWRTIEQGIRTAGSWMDAYHYFLGSPSMTPEAHCTFLKSFVDHGRTLTRMALEHPEHGGNWVTMECNGLAHIGVMFPEFREAEQWRTVAYERLDMELDRQVYPDGAQKELTTGYHQVALRNFKAALDPALRNDVPVPPGYLDKLKRMYQYNLYCMMPGGLLPPLNDAGMTRVLRYLQEAHETWGDPEFLWGATQGKQGRALDFTSYAFPWAGQYVMRSGWDQGARYLMFEAGPFGIGHQHEDKLSLFLFAYGRPLLTEPGNYVYDRSKWRRHVLSTAAHNTIMVDGLGQHRRGLGETYEAKQPLADNWHTGDVFDWVIGTYDDGYGPTIGPDGKAQGREHDIKDIRHERTVVFVRPDYYVVIDRLLGQGEHRYESLFHLDSDEANVDRRTMRVDTTNADAPNLAVVPVALDGLSLSIVKGQEDPVQGWLPSDRHRPIPTAIYEKTGTPPQLFVTLLVPYPAGDAPEIEAALLETGVGLNEAVALSVRLGGGRDLLLYSFDQPRELSAAGVRANARVALVRNLADGQQTVGAMDGRVISAGERP
ncbi:MAG: heparinase II/III family protein [Armatimonadota bacterium]